LSFQAAQIRWLFLILATRSSARRRRPKPVRDRSLLFDAEFSPAGKALSRLAGFALLALALACWPRLGAETRLATRALCLFSALSAIYLVYLGAGSGLVGLLLWPAAVGHAVLAILLLRDWLAGSRSAEITGR